MKSVNIAKDGRYGGRSMTSLVFEIPDDFTREDIAVIERIMTQSYAWGTVANGTDIAIMKRWGKGVTPEDWFKQKEAA